MSAGNNDKYGLSSSGHIIKSIMPQQLWMLATKRPLTISPIFQVLLHFSHEILKFDSTQFGKKNVKKG